MKEWDRQQGQHVIQEAHPGGNIRLASAVQIQFHSNLSFFRIPFHFPLPHNHASLVYWMMSRMAPMIWGFSSALPTVIRRPPGSRGFRE